MSIKKIRVAALVAGILAMVMFTAGGTYAYFTSTAASSNNTFTAGTLKVDGIRDDLPVQGPMFYTSGYDTGNSSGFKPDRYWGPGYTVGKSMIIKNTGTLPAVLKSIKADKVTVKDGSGQRVETDTADLIKNDYTVSIYYVTANDNVKNFYNKLNEAQNAFNTMSEDPTFIAKLQSEKQAALKAVYDSYLKSASKGTIKPFLGSPKSVYELDSETGITIASGPELQSGDVMALIYIVTLQKNDFVDQNYMQGKELKFDFVNTFGQKPR